MRRVLLGFALLSGCATTSRSGGDVASETRPLPEVEVVTLSAQPTSLRANLARRPTLISLWATWCESCVAEIGALGRLSSQVVDKGGYVVAVSEGEPLATVKGFLAHQAPGYPQLVDEKFLLSDAIGARSVPTTLVVDRHGNVVFRGGALDEAALRALDRALARQN